MKKCFTLLLLFYLLGNDLNAQISFSEFPRDLQLYQRNVSGSALVKINAENAANSVYTQLSCKILRDKILYGYAKVSPGNDRIFKLNLPIKTGLYEYTIQISGHKKTGDSVLIKEATRVLCGDIVAIYGQSNSFGYIGLDTMGFNPVYRKFIRNISSPQGQTSVTNLTWYEGYEPYGHLGIFGLRLGALLVASENIPQGFVNGAVGGAHIRLLNDRNIQDPFDPGTTYGKFLLRLKFANPEMAFNYLIWRQGESDVEDELRASSYTENFTKLRTDLLTDVTNLKRIYVSQNDLMAKTFIGNGKNASFVREQQRQFADKFPNLTVFATVGTKGYDGLHYTYLGHDEIARKLLPHIRHTFYGNANSIEINSPNIQRAVYNATRDSLFLIFDAGQKISFQNAIKYATYTRNLKDYIVLDDPTISIVSGNASKNIACFKLNKPSNATTVTYLPNFIDDQFSIIYDGPLLRNSRGLPALTFKDIPITVQLGRIKEVSYTIRNNKIRLLYEAYKRREKLMNVTESDQNPK